MVAIPGATLVVTSGGLMILKYGESAWYTLTSLETYKYFQDKINDFCVTLFQGGKYKGET